MYMYAIQIGQCVGSLTAPVLANGAGCDGANESFTTNCLTALWGIFPATVDSSLMRVRWQEGGRETEERQMCLCQLYS